MDMVFYNSREAWLQHINIDSNSGIHHHAWIKDDVVAMFKYVGLKVVYSALSDFTIHIIAEKRAIS
jgi:hypothetical protein